MPPCWFGCSVAFCRERSALVGSKATTLSDCDDNDFFIMFNSSTKDLTVTVCPPLPGKKWFRVIDTSRESPDDFLESGKEELLFNQSKYVVLARSSVVLLARIV